MAGKTSKSGSERRRRTLQISFRPGDDLYGKMVAKGNELGCGPNTVGKIAAANFCGLMEPVKVRKSPRKSSAKVPPEILELGQFLSQIKQLGPSFNQAMKEINTAHRTGEIHPGLYVHLSQAQDDLKDMFEAVIGTIENYIRRDDDEEESGAKAEYL